MEPVTDPADPRLADYRDLTDADARGRIESGTDAGLFIVEGVVALGRVLTAGLPVRSVLVTTARADTLVDLLDTVPDGVPVLVADRTTLRGVTGFDVHRGVLASVARLPLPDPALLLERCRRVVLTEGLNDHENLGSLFRNAAALGLDAVLLDGRTADPLYRRAVRVSSGWSAVLPHARVGAVADGLGLLRTAGFRCVALTPAADALAVDAAVEQGALDDPVALVVGAEGPGLTAGALGGCEVRVRVPMARDVDSLNVATSLAVVAAAAASRRGWDSPRGRVSRP